MAYQVIDPITLTPTVSNATTYTFTVSSLGLTLVNDDYVVLYVHTHATTGTLSIAGSGWSELVELDVTSGGQMAVYACKVASGTVADPTITATVTTTWQVTLNQWRDADTTTFAEIPTPTQANASSVASATFTPATDDCTIVYFGAVRGNTGQHCRFLSDKVVASANPQVDIGSSSFAMAIGTVQQATAAATAQTFYAAESARLGCITMAVKNKTGGKLSRDCRAAMTKVGWFGNYGTVHESLGSLTFNAPSTFCVWNAGTEAMAGINVDTAALTPTHTTTGLPPINGRYTDMPSTLNTAGTDRWVGVWWATPSTLDMTGKIFTMEWFMAQLGDAIGEKGVVIGFGDNASADTGNAAVFQLAPKLHIPINTLITSHIAVETATQLASVGSITWSTINKIGIFYHRSGSNTNNRSVSWRNMFLHGSSVMTGGNATVPLNAQFLDKVLNGWGYTGLCTKSGDATLVKTSIQFGDGTAATHVDTSATLLNTPAKYSVNSQPYWNVPPNTITIGVKGAAGDTLNFTSSALVAGPGAEQNFTVDAATSATALPSLQGGVFGNWLWTGDTDFDAVGATYSGCDEVAWKGAAVTDCTVTDTTSTDAAASVDANTTITNTTIDGTGALYALKLKSAVTAVTLADCALTAGSTDKILVQFPDTTVAATAMVSGTIYEVKTKGTTTWTSHGATSAAVTFQDTGDTVTYNAHGMENGDVVYFSAITSTTGISVDTVYYVVNKAANTFQVAATRGGAALPLTTDGSGTVVVGKFEATGVGAGTGDAYSGVKITVSGTTSLAAGDVIKDTGCANTPVKIAAPQPTLSATGLANTRYLLWNRTTSAELDNTFVAGTTWSKVITSGASSGDVLDLYAFKEGYAEARATLIYSGDDASFAVDQVVDDAVDYYRTQESITDYTTLTEYNFYAPDIYIQADDADGENKLARLFIFYNGVLTTEDGARYMRGGVTFNSPFDVVINRSVRAIAVDNVSVTHGLHFTDEDVIRVTTDDGTSWIAPPSAPGSIRYAFGVSPGQIETGVSGVTAQDIVDISDAAAAAVVADGKTLTVPKFLGLK